MFRRSYYYCIIISIFALSLWFLWHTLRFLFPLFLPFLLALGLSWLMEPLLLVLHKKVGLSRNLSALFVTLGGLLVGGSLLFLLGKRALYELQLLLRQLPAFLTQLPDFSDSLAQWVYPFIVATPIPIQSVLWDGLSQVTAMSTQLISTASQGLFQGWLTLLTRLPIWGFFCFTTILATYFTAATRPALFAWCGKALPPTWQEWFLTILPRLRTLFGGWLRAQGILMSICFFQLTLGFFFLGQPYPLLLAGSIAFIDALPVFGTGTILIPWALFSLLQGHLSHCLSLLLLYGLVTVVRGFLEPRLVGNRVGLPPLVTLFAIYVGFHLMGVWGLLLAPILAVFCKAIFPPFPSF